LPKLGEVTKVYCPGCGIQAGDENAFCRACGANLDLVSRALTGKLVPAETAEEMRRRARADRTSSVVKTYHDETERSKRRSNSAEQAITSIFCGLSFILVSLAIWKFLPAGHLWWFWLLIPAFSLLGKGLAQLLTYSQNRAAVAQQGQLPVAPVVPKTGEIPPRDRYQMSEPPSVVEGTTKLMDRANSD